RSLKGYWTIYTYAHTSAGSVTSISQNAQAASSNWEVRALVYDGLDRLVSETMPESGISNFTFDAESNHCGIANAGDMVMKQDAMGNISCYAHDAAHRLTAVTYPPGPIPVHHRARSLTSDSVWMRWGIWPTSTSPRRTRAAGITSPLAIGRTVCCGAFRASACRASATARTARGERARFR